MLTAQYLERDDYVLKTTSDFLKVMREDEEISELIKTSKVLWRDYKPRHRSTSKKFSSRASIAVKNFFNSDEVHIFRCTFERKHGVNICDNKQISALKDALQIYVSKVDHGELKL